jgi:hypothetical protein
MGYIGEIVRGHRFKAIRRGDYVLIIESFVSTNHVEASVVAENVASALLDSGVNVIYVTFLRTSYIGLYPSTAGKPCYLSRRG